MPLLTEILNLPTSSPGLSRHLTVLRFRGAAPGPKAYIQAAVHADEVPALLVAQQLRAQLLALDTAGRLRGEILLLPYANPIGLGQFLHGHQLGRFELDGGQNFNRSYPDLFEPVAAALEGRLGPEASANVACVRAALRTALSQQSPVGENAALKQRLYSLSCDADVVLDLHCESEAILHSYIGTPLWPEAADLAACLGSEVNLLAEDSGGSAFDEANSRLWWRLAAHFPQHPIPPACLAATIELRGDRDVDDSLAAADAAGLIRFLAGRGFVDGMSGPLQPTATASPLEAVDTLHASLAGVLSWTLPLGAELRRGEVLGHLTDPETGRREPLVARNEGRLFARRGHRWVRPGQWLAKIAGAEPLPWRRAGALLGD